MVDEKDVIILMKAGVGSIYKQINKGVKDEQRIKKFKYRVFK